MRPNPTHRHRRAQPDPSTARRTWTALAEAAVRLGASCDGSASWAEPLDFRVALAGAPALPAARGDAMAIELEAGFRSCARAMLLAGTPERRAIAGPLLTAAGRAIDLMLFELIRPDVELSRRISGEREDD